MFSLDLILLKATIKKELLAAQKEDHQKLAAAERLASTPDFSWLEKRANEATEESPTS